MGLSSSGGLRRGLRSGAGDNLLLRRLWFGLNAVEPQGWREAHDEHENDKRRKDGELAEAQVGNRLRGGRSVLRAVKQALHQRKHVGSAEDHSQRGGHGPTAADTSEGAREDDEFA